LVDPTPDIQNFSIVRAGNVQLTVPTWTIAGQLTDSTTGEILRDFTGGNTVSFPQVLGSLTAAEQDDLVAFLVRHLLKLRFGV
jgi:hypothetical protein